MERVGITKGDTEVWWRASEIILRFHNGEWDSFGRSYITHEQVSEWENLRTEALARMPKRVEFKGFIGSGVNSYQSDSNEEIIQDFKSCIFKIFEENTKVKVIIEEVQE